MLYGLLGVIIIIGIAVMPVIKLSIITIAYKLTSAAIEPIADSKITGLLEQLGDIFKLFLGVLCALSFMLIIGTTLVLKISNSGMMYRQVDVMIDFLSTWAEKIALSVIVISILEMLIPNNKMKKYIRVVMGIFILFNIISPLIEEKDLINMNNLDLDIETFSRRK